MDITQLPKPKTYPRTSGPRCGKKVRSTSTGDWMESKSRCCRVARFEIDGAKFCEQHAGGVALYFLLNEAD